MGPPGGVAEWSKAAVLKTAVPQGTVGSNPTASARIDIRMVIDANALTGIAKRASSFGDVSEWPKERDC